MKTFLVTDCKSLYDRLKCDGKVPDDRHTAIYVAALRGLLAARRGNKAKTALRWVPSRCQVADGLTKIGLEKIFMAGEEERFVDGVSGQPSKHARSVQPKP